MADMQELIRKVNFARSSDFLKRKEFVEQNFPFPKDREEEKELYGKMIYSYLKKRFVGCKLRLNSQTFSLRLDGQVHRKAKIVKEKVIDDPTWRTWFLDNHRDIVRTVERNTNPFNGGPIETRLKDGKQYLYYPLALNRISHFDNHGLMNIYDWTEARYERELAVANLYDQVIALMEERIETKRRETRQRIERDETAFRAHIQQNLLIPIGQFNPEGTNFQDKLDAKMHAWCTENGLTPAIAVEPTYSNVLFKGLNVDIIVENEDVDTNWFPVPTFGGYDMPEGYHLLNGYGEVTGFSTDHPRSNNGANPVVVMKEVYLQFDANLWKNHFPAHYDAILEATKRFTEEVNEEIAAHQAQLEYERQIRLEQERMERERRIQEELAQLADLEAAEKAVKEAELLETAREQERLARLKEQLVAQLGKQEETTPVDPTTFANGIYRNDRAIPLEKYVVVINGRVRRCANLVSAIDFMRGAGFIWAQLEAMGVKNYTNTEEVVENIRR